MDQVSFDINDEHCRALNIYCRQTWYYARLISRCGNYRLPIDCCVSGRLFLTASYIDAQVSELA
jgi:hypothetical protein